MIREVFWEEYPGLSGLEGIDMGDFLNRLFGREKKTAKQAKERLQLVLIHDRAALNPGKIDMLKDEMIDVLSRHIDVDPSAVHIKMTQDGRQQRLIADIPLMPVNKRRLR